MVNEINDSRAGSDPPDAQLVAEVLGGDAAAASALVGRHYAVVWAIAYARLRDANAADDLAQEVLVMSLLQLKKLADPSRYAAWISQIAHHRAVDFLRSKRRQSRLLEAAREHLPRSEPARPVTEAEAEESRQILHDAILTLPEQQRTIVMLRFVQGLNLEQIGAHLALHPATVGRNLEKGLGTLRRRLRLLDDAAVERQGREALASSSRRSAGSAVALAAVVVGLPWSQQQALAAIGGKVPLLAASGKSVFAVSRGVKIMASLKIAAVTVSSVVLIGAAIHAANPGIGPTTPPANAPATKVPAANAAAASPAPESDEAILRKVRQQCLPQEVCNFLLDKVPPLTQELDPSGDLTRMTQYNTIDNEGTPWMAFVLDRHNNANGHIDLGGMSTKGPFGIISDTEGYAPVDRLANPLNPFGPARASATISEPWPAGKMKRFVAITRWTNTDARLKPDANNEYQIRLYNQPGLESIQQLVLVLPAAWSLVDSAETPDQTFEVGTSHVIVWQKHVDSGADDFAVFAKVKRTTAADTVQAAPKH